MTARDIVLHMCKLFTPSNINWAKQMTIANKLLKKYTSGEIIYALNYYHNLGTEMYSLGFLLYGRNMNNPVSLYTAEKHINEQESVNSGERNRNKIRQYSETKYREEYPVDLFTESCEDN